MQISEITLNLMKLISHIFEPETMFPFIFLLGVSVYFLTKDKINSSVLISSSILTTSIVYSLKLLIDKPRPENMLILESAGKAFPSGHSAVAGVFTVLVIYFLNLHFKKAINKNTFLKKYKNLVYVFVVILFLLIPMSRLYLQVHDMYDVIAGYGIGLIVTISCIKYSHKFFKRKDY